MVLLFVVSENMTPDFGVKQIFCPGYAGPGKSVSSSNPLSYFETTKSLGIRNFWGIRNIPGTPSKGEFRKFPFL